MLAMKRRDVSKLGYILNIKSTIIAGGLHEEKWGKVELGRKGAKFCP